MTTLQRRLAPVSSLALLLLTCATPVPATLCEVELRLGGAAVGSARRVGAVGDWNDWTPGRTVLVVGDDGDYSATLRLPPGDYAYLVMIDDELLLDPAAPLRHLDTLGRESSLLRVDDCRLPRWELGRAEVSEEGALVVEARFCVGVGGAALDRGSLEASLDDELPVVVLGEEVLTVRAEGLSPGRHTLRLAARDIAGLATPQLVVPGWVEASGGRGPFSWEGALIYQVVIDRFALSGPPLDAGLPREEALTARHGGDLLGLLEVLRSGYFEHLGVGALWLSPLYDNPDDLWPWYLGLQSSAYHGYWPIAAREVEPLLGGEEAAQALIEEAHARGLRVILDVVPNHVHLEHPYFAEHAGEGWFNGPGDCVCGSSCSWAEDLDRCWFSEYLPDLRWQNPAVARQVVDDTLFWLDAFDLDGLRIDAIPMMPLLATRELVDAVRRRFEPGQAEVHLLGETYAADHETISRALGPFGLDGQFDFPVMWELRRVIARGQGSLRHLDEVIGESERAWEEAGGGAGGRAIMSPFLGNHDLPRFLSEAAGDDVFDPVGAPPPAPDDDEPYRRLLLAQALVMTLPGAPVLFYGDEVGLPGATDPDNRRPMRFDDELALRESEALDEVARLGRLRACLPSLRRGGRSTVLADQELLVFQRDLGDGAPALVVLHRGEGTSEIAFELPEGLLLSTPLVDALSGLEVPFDGHAVGPFTLPRLTAAVLVPRSSGCVLP